MPSAQGNLVSHDCCALGEQIITCAGGAQLAAGGVAGGGVAAGLVVVGLGGAPIGPHVLTSPNLHITCPAAD